MTQSTAAASTRAAEQLAQVCGAIVHERQAIAGAEGEWWFYIDQCTLPIRTASVLLFLVAHGALERLPLGQAPVAVQRRFQEQSKQCFSIGRVICYQVADLGKLQRWAAQPPAITAANLTHDGRHQPAPA